ncbi:nicotinamide-nucleotide amidase [Novosphingobium chloroacetimidivorans]|uniref:Nicotinamide-nucleotide amidase n=1 Tax=Novosphingobium chloroacetimidivorans TaxID=1428314 RepID=A0A7W7KDD7_9SPHN|nr:CinA family protein [Novosphingobium chloroacetimidivorans]MBB4860173.1 nicotinamide-nucleotide amidase [Novosphingobium chloroacetimidivorans]
MAETLEETFRDEALGTVERLLGRACKRDLSIATAESCTGGLLAALLTDIPDCSHAFERGFVVYTPEAKSELLSIPLERIERYGVVSREIAEDMAQGTLKASHADIALSVTGFAGPGAPEDEEGLVHLACARRGMNIDHRENHFGAIGRAGIRRATIDVALDMLERAVEL